MKLKLLSLGFMLFMGIIGLAQNEVTISGTVIDADDKAPLEYATVSFFSKTENKIITGGITDNKGAFKIEVPSGTYNVSVEYLSYKTKTYEDRTLSTDMNLGTVSLALNLEALDAVEVVAEKTTVEIKLDKKIYNVGRDLTVRGGTVSDVLDNVPSVSVDVEGNVALRGNENVRILINGKPSGLVGLNSTDALRQLPAESIERVEVITSPSARYDAEGTAGILNIILRRSKLQGLNGAVTLNAGDPTQAGVSGNINYRTGDFNFFNTSGYRYRESPGNATTKTEFFNDDDPNTFFNEFRTFDRKSRGFNTNVGVEWYVNETSSITASFLYRDSDQNNDNSNVIREFDSNRNLINESIRLDPEEETDITRQYSFNYDKQFGGDSQHRLTFDFQYEDNGEVEQSLIAQDGDAAERVRTAETQDEVLLQMDYTRPIGEQSNFEFGYRGTFEELDTDYTLEFNENGTFVLDTDQSNNLVFRQYVNAVYSQFGSKIKDKFSYLLGLRMESTRITIDQVTTGSLDRKNYTGLFPTVNLGYEISEKQSITLGYNRRIRRPRSRFINTFPSRSSATNLFQGNPDLDPSYSNTVDLGYLNRFGKMTLNSSIYYTRATDVFTFVSLDTGDTAIVGGTEVPIIRRSPINLATNDRYGFEFTLTYRPSKKWNVNGNLNLFKSVTEGFFEGTDFGAENFSWFARINNKYTLPGSIDWQTRLFYRGPSEDAQTVREGIFSMDLAFSKDLLKDKASLAVNVSDVFNSRKRKFTSTTPTFIADGEFQFRQRSFNLTFTYRFNQQKQRQQQNGGRNGGGDDFDFSG
ncbi:TonB-dependent receptor domain-containing protein [Psychroserpens luteolus]|uniref:TonB-dependent receptor domain-containing protein n=1 Tax=Psychroserpens luteolus TaxID=2855840 RepID=UPI001E28A270|nr:TonB-dependent receptor [Psychroserpens luteolus]MCD2259042.1 TonB-dependent receptor [Psychroserpens luteolus]